MNQWRYGKADKWPLYIFHRFSQSEIHRYIFKVYALNTVLDLDKNTNKEILEQGMKDHVIGEAEMIGVYGKN